MKPSNQKEDMSNKEKFLFLGILFSSFGSMLFVCSIPTILSKEGVSIASLGTLLGLIRFSSFFANLFLGQIGDKFTPFKITLICEFFAAIISAGLFYISYQFNPSNDYLPFLVLSMIRVIFVATNQPSAQKLLREIDQSELKDRNIVLYNSISYGSLAFAGLFYFIFKDNIKLTHVLIIDSFSFMINGLAIWIACKSLKTKLISSEQKKLHFFSITAYLKSSSKIWIHDLVLCLPLLGANTLNLKLLPNHIDYVPILSSMFGVGAILANHHSLRLLSRHSTWMWLGLFLSLSASSMCIDIPYLLIPIAICRNFSYWFIFQKISQNTSTLSKSDDFSSIMAGRQAFTVSILSAGEILVGQIPQSTIKVEMIARALIALFAFFYFKRQENHYSAC